MQVGPSGSHKEDDKIEGEENASRGNTTPVTSSGAPTQMEVDLAPGSLASQPEQEEKKDEEPMAHEEEAQADVPPVLPQHDIPPVLPHQDVTPVLPRQTGGEDVVTQVTEGVVMPPPIVSSLKEKALVPENEKAPEEVPTKEIEGQTSVLIPSAPEKAKRPFAPVKPIDENEQASDDVQPMEINDEEYRKKTGILSVVSS